MVHGDSNLDLALVHAAFDIFDLYYLYILSSSVAGEYIKLYLGLVYVQSFLVHMPHISSFWRLPELRIIASSSLLINVNAKLDSSYIKFSNRCSLLTPKWQPFKHIRIRSHAVMPRSASPTRSRRSSTASSSIPTKCGSQK